MAFPSIHPDQIWLMRLDVAMRYLLSRIAVREAAGSDGARASQNLDGVPQRRADGSTVTRFTSMESLYGLFKGGKSNAV